MDEVICIWMSFCFKGDEGNFSILKIGAMLVFYALFGVFGSEGWALVFPMGASNLIVV